MNQYEWLTCEDVHKMGTEITVKQASLVSAAIRSNGLLCELPKTDSMCIHYWHEGGCHGMSFKKKHQPLVCDLIREVVGNPFRPIYHVKDYLNDAFAGHHVQATARIATSDKNLLRKELDSRVFLPEWLTPRVQSFAQGIIESERYNDVPALADLLEEAGCDNEEILRHLRQEVRCPGCHRVYENNAMIEYHDCKTDGWLPKPVSCQAGCWVLRLLTEGLP